MDFAGGKLCCEVSSLFAWLKVTLKWLDPENPANPVFFRFIPSWRIPLDR